MATDHDNKESAAVAPPHQSDGEPPSSGLLRKSGVAIVGIVVILIGIPLIPLFGPGWLIVFTGLAILSSEFEWAGRLRDSIRSRLRSFLGNRSAD